MQNICTVGNQRLASVVPRVNSIGRAEGADEAAVVRVTCGLANLSKLMNPSFKVPVGGVYTYEAPHSFKAKAAKEVSAMRLGFDATALIHQVSRGLPRAVNNLAIHALISAAAARKKIVDESSARQDVKETTHN